MAEASVSVDQFSCPVCLDLLKEPVTIPCGHSYCMRCIKNCWDLEGPTGAYSCPQCRHHFIRRPQLFKSVLLAEMMEKLKAELRNAEPAGPGDVQCDVCVGRKVKAVKSCLVCLNSYCQSHFERHEEFHPGKRHKVMDATRRLQDMICPKHDKLLEVFCRTDQMCVCMMCMVDEHRNHDTVSTALQRAERETHLKDMQMKCQQRIRQRESDLQQLRETVGSHKSSAQAAVRDAERIFTELIHSIVRRRDELTQQIRDQERAAVGRAEELLKQLEQEIRDLRRREAELGELTHTQDNIHFLQALQSLSVPPWDASDSSALQMARTSQLSFNVNKTISVLRKKLEDFCSDTESTSDKLQDMKSVKTLSVRDPMTREQLLLLKSKLVKTIPLSDPRTREEFLQYFCPLTLDANTVNPVLRLSHGNRVVYQGDECYNYREHPDRFKYWEQVLCRESVSGRSYWEVERSSDGVVNIGVSYKSICRRGGVNNRQGLFGCNDHSWSLCCSDSRISFSHDSIERELPVASGTRKVGVYVDHGAGILSFYSVSIRMTLIHRVQTRFTQPLYPGFRVYYGTLVKLCDLPVVRWPAPESLHSKGVPQDHMGSWRNTRVLERHKQ